MSFRLPNRLRYVLVALFIGIIFWLCDSLLDYWTYHSESGLTVAQVLFTQVPAHEFYIRGILLAVLLVSGYMIGAREERKDAKFAQIIRQGDQFRELYDHSPVAMIVIDEDMLISDLNTAALKLYDKPREELIGQRNGNAVSCVNAQGRPCGDSAACSECLIRSTVLDTFKQGVGQQGSRSALLRTLDIETGETTDRFFHVSSSLITENEQQYVLLALTATPEPAAFQIF